VIHVSDAAVAEIKRRMADLTATESAVRIGIQPGGCSGLEYVLAFEEERPENEIVHRQDGLVFLCDETSRPGLEGLLLDYRDALVGGGVRFKNPNVRRTCGCGASFQLDRPQ